MPHKPHAGRGLRKWMVQMPTSLFRRYWLIVALFLLAAKRAKAQTSLSMKKVGASRIAIGRATSG